MKFVRKYRDDLYSELMRIKAVLVDNCPTCRGIGYLLDAENREYTCECMIIFRYISRLVYSEIPREYWTLFYDELEVSDEYRDILTFYIKYLDNAINKLKGILFIGANGVGKTSMLCEIGKQFLIKGYTVKYFTSEKYLTQLKMRDEGKIVLEDIDSAQVHLLDELGKAYVKKGSDYVLSQTEEYIRRAVTTKVLICSTNFEESELVEMFGESTISVMKRHLKFVHVEGQDKSKSVYKSWVDDLSSDFDYFHPNILKMAKLQRENERVADEHGIED